MSASRKLSRELLLSKTAHLFAMRGYEESTITTITAELGVTRPTLYTYMHSKQELIEAIYDQLFDFYRQALPEYVHPEDPPLLRIRGIIELQLEATSRLRDHLIIAGAAAILLGDRGIGQRVLLCTGLVLVTKRQDLSYHKR